MKLAPRIRVRTLMAIIALVGLGFGVSFELIAHARRDRLLKAMNDRYRQVARHQQRAMECQVFEARQLPYGRTEREKLLLSDGLRHIAPSGGFRSWQGELGHHLFWASRIHDEADSSYQDLQALDATLLLP